MDFKEKEDIIKQCVELIWDYGESIDDFDIEIFQNKFLSTYEKYNVIKTYFDEVKELKDKNKELG